MKKLLSLFIALMVCMYACKTILPTQSQEKELTPSLIDYSATPWKTEFSYYITEGDTCQMTFQRSVMNVWYSEQEGGIIVNVKIQH